MAGSLVNTLSSFSKAEAAQLFKIARTKLKQQGLEIRIAPKLKAFGRILIVIPARSGNAVKRNLIRRRLKSIFYQERLFEQNQDYIILVHKEAIKLSFHDLKNILLALFSPF